MDRRKSFHEISPPSDDVPYDRYAIAGGYFNSLVGNSHVPTNISRYEDEVNTANSNLYITPFYVRFTMHSNLEAAEIYIPSRAVVLALMRVGKGKENDLRYTKRWRKGHQNLDEMSERKLSKGHIPFI